MLRYSLFLGLCLCTLAGCTRRHYRQRADEDARAVLEEKTHQTPWSAPVDYSIYPQTDSRLYDSSLLEDPQLPTPSPSLYSFQLPQLPQRDPARFQPAESDPFEFPDLPTAVDHGLRRLPALTRSGRHSSSVQSASFTTPRDPRAPVAAAQESHPNREFLALQAEQEPPSLEKRSPEDDQPVPAYNENSPTVQRLAIPALYWQSLPASCLRRLLEFESIRQEFQETFGSPPQPDQLDTSPRLTLEDIIDLTRANQRDYQAQKEQLYLTSLSLGQRRFEQQLKPSAGGNRSSGNFNHSRSGGDTSTSMSIPSQLGVDKMLVTGADLAARFANQVLLTFNGSQGFSADVSSNLLFNFSQSLIQRDAQLEQLTQAERGVVYAARNFTRFRKTLFSNQVSSYYGLIRQFRQIEIQTQNYFNLIRSFKQREAEYLTLGTSSRTDVDQIEQNVLSGQSSLINATNSLDRGLDNLKVSIGLPVEQQINLDLTELTLLTRRDELAVNGESIRRFRRRLEFERNQEPPSQDGLISSSLVLIERIFDFIAIQEQIGQQVPDVSALKLLQTRLRISESRLLGEESLEKLNREMEADPPSIPNLLQRRMEVIEQQLQLLGDLLALLRLQGLATADVTNFQQQARALEEQMQELNLRFQQLISDAQLDQLPTLLVDAAKLQEAIVAQVTVLDRQTQLDTTMLNPEQRLEESLRHVDYLLRATEMLLSIAGLGLAPLEIDVDDAMLTALTQRYDIMNQRGSLADSWRQIKLSSDELKSILNLQASHVIRTPSDSNRPFDLSIDESTTSVGVTFDAPLNRRSQRNGYRQSLINYQAALRRMMQLEDSVKLSVRNDLRSIDLGKQQYLITVASAALAKDRVVATELQLRLGVEGIRARDFLESQQAYISALNGVASQHIDFILARMQLFLDLELLTVDDNDFWQDLYDESVQPQPRLQPPLPDEPGYGRLTPRLKHSKRIRRMLDVPREQPQIIAPPAPDAAVPTEAAGDAQ